MTNKDKKLEILRLLDAKCKHHFRESLIKKADLEAAEAGAKQWDREHPDDGVGCFSANRWNPQGAAASFRISDAEYKKWQEICDYAINQLVE